MQICATIYTKSHKKFIKLLIDTVFPYTLPSFAKMLIGFHDIYRPKWKKIYPFFVSN